MATRREEREFVAILAREFPASTITRLECVRLAEKLMRWGRAYCRIQERWCSEHVDKESSARLVKKEQRIELSMKDACEPYGIMVLFSGDPRGATVKLVVPSRYTNDIGQTGVCVPDS